MRTSLNFLATCRSYAARRMPTRLSVADALLGSAGVDGVDDLGVVDALQVHRGDPEVGVPELALDDIQRYTLSGHFDRVRVA